MGTQAVDVVGLGALIINNWGAILAGVSSLAGVGLVVSRYTKTDKDDKFFKRIIGAVTPKKIK